MPYNRPKTFDVKLTEPDKKLLETLSKRHHLSQKEIVGYLIDLCDKHDLLTGDWKGRLEDLDEDRERYTRLEGSCPALTYADHSHWCLWGQDGKPPAKKKLAKDLDEALEMCAACNKTLSIKLENESYQVKVQELEAKLAVKSTQKFRVPQCDNGGRLSKDSTAFEGCPRSRGKPVSITEYCKKINEGQGCIWLKMHLIGVGAGETTNPDDMK